MARPLVPEELWALVEPLLPPVPNRAALGGILFVLKTGIPWAMLPTDGPCSPPMGHAPHRDGLRLGHDLLAAAP